MVRLADHVITGEGDLKFAEVCRCLLNPRTNIAASSLLPHPDPLPLGEGTANHGVEQFTANGPKTATVTSAPARTAFPPLPAGEGRGEGESSRISSGSRSQLTPLPKIIPAELPKLEDVALPYDLYTPDDLAHRVVYVEASRGCPFTCEFCLSSLDIPVRQFPLEPFLAAMDRLLARGATQFKFVDRTFNLNLHVSRAILQFFLARMRPGLFVHFEMVPDRLPEQLREVIAQFPPGSLQFEVGIQTFDELTSRNISRRQDHARLAENLTWLRTQTGVHVHADLIVGLPGENLASFAAGFDRLVAMGPQEIQVGILKRLRGTPIIRHDAEYALRYSPQPPYELLCNRDLDFPTMQRLRRFARYWDLVANSGNFRATTPLLWSSGSRVEGRESSASASALDPRPSTLDSAFERFLAFSDWLYARVGKRHGIALDALAEALFVYLTTVAGLAAPAVAASIIADFERAGRRERPACLQPHLPAAPRPAAKPARATAPKRQAKHLPVGEGTSATL
ncbi:MAG: DUF4080 domain-containing protein [Proteobacteria bacterium]|nr:DUF4080 domain-containing protein [Pseudomonadota bacterium]